MNTTTTQLSQRERELSAIITAYNEVTDQLKRSHETLSSEVMKLRLEIESKNKELARHERLAALGEMAAGVAHEIRNPLGGIQLYASLLDRDLTHIPASQKLVRKISAGVDSLERIVSDVLDFAGKHEVQASPSSLQVIVSNVFDIAANRALAKNVRLLLDTSVLEHEIFVDQQQIERALLNIVLNGIDSVDACGIITVSAEYGEDGSSIICISDDGHGINEDNLDRIFNPFFTTKDTGSGLGLAIVHRIIESHGGSISVHNREEGGACFTIRLPSDYIR